MHHSKWAEAPAEPSTRHRPPGFCTSMDIMSGTDASLQSTKAPANPVSVCGVDEKAAQDGKEAQPPAKSPLRNRDQNAPFSSTPAHGHTVASSPDHSQRSPSPQKDKHKTQLPSQHLRQMPATQEEKLKTSVPLEQPQRTSSPQKDEQKAPLLLPLTQQTSLSQKNEPKVPVSPLQPRQMSLAKDDKLKTSLSQAQPSLLSAPKDSKLDTPLVLEHAQEHIKYTIGNLLALSAGALAPPLTALSRFPSGVRRVSMIDLVPQVERRHDRTTSWESEATLTDAFQGLSIVSAFSTDQNLDSSEARCIPEIDTGPKNKIQPHTPPSCQLLQPPNEFKASTSSAIPHFEIAPASTDAGKVGDLEDNEILSTQQICASPIPRQEPSVPRNVSPHGAARKKIFTTKASPITPRDSVLVPRPEENASSSPSQKLSSGAFIIGDPSLRKTPKPRAAGSPRPSASLLASSVHKGHNTKDPVKRKGRGFNRLTAVPSEKPVRVDSKQSSLFPSPIPTIQNNVAQAKGSVSTRSQPNSKPAALRMTEEEFHELVLKNGAKNPGNLKYLAFAKASTQPDSYKDSSQDIGGLTSTDQIASRRSGFIVAEPSQPSRKLDLATTLPNLDITKDDKPGKLAIEEFNSTGWKRPRDRSRQELYRRVIVCELPPTWSVRDVVSVVYGGALEKIDYKAKDPYATITFIDPYACRRYDDQSASGIEYEGHLIRTTLDRSYSEPVSNEVKGYLEQGATRCVLVVGSKDDLSVGAQMRLAKEKGRVVEHISVGKNERGEREMKFRFCSIMDAISLFHQLRIDADWKQCRVTFYADPCQHAKGVHN